MATHTRNVRIRIQPYLAQLKGREMTNRECAALLDVTEEHISRTLTEIGFEKDPAVDRAAQKAATAAKRAAIASAATSMTPEDAARACGVSVRTIYRYLDKNK